MPTLAGRQRKQRTNASSVNSSQVFNSPGIYQPKFGKNRVYVSGRGSPGNAPTSGGTYTNPPTPGNYAGTNPATPGTVMYNPPTPGNTGVNAPGGGTYAGRNPPTEVPQNAVGVINYSRGDPTAYDSYRYLAPTTHTPYTVYMEHTTNYRNPAGGYEYQVWTLSESPAPGNAYYNPATPGTPYTNSPTPGNVRYNSPTPGNQYTTTPTYVAAETVPGNYVAGNYVAGNTNPGTYTPGPYVAAVYTPGSTIPGNMNSPVYSPGNPVPGYTNPEVTTPGNPMPGYYDSILVGRYQSCPVGWTNEGFEDGYNESTQGIRCTIDVAPYTNAPVYTAGTYVEPYVNAGTYTEGFRNPTEMYSSTYTAAYSLPGTYTPGNTNTGYNNSYYNAPYTNPESYIPGGIAYNPPTPGNIMYNPPTPGAVYYNPVAPGNVVVVPASSGSQGTPFVSLGVTFPGGPAGSPAPMVSDTLVNIPYTVEAVSVPVGAGGQVIVKETL